MEGRVERLLEKLGLKVEAFPPGFDSMFKRMLDENPIKRPEAFVFPQGGFTLAPGETITVPDGFVWALPETPTFGQVYTTWVTTTNNTAQFKEELDGKWMEG
jgi:hypothetical protein